MKTNITSRAGCFTPSSAWRLMTNNKKGDGFGAQGLSYIAEKKHELKLGRQISIEKNPRSASWGTFLQHRVLNVLLDTSYKPVSDKRFQHPVFPNVNGSPDFLRDGEIGDIKCFELLEFCRTHDAATAGHETFKKECEDIFWQLVMNCDIHNVSKGHMVLYVPYQNELNTIREEAEATDEHRFSWIKFASDDELPYLLPDHHYPNLSSFTFDITEADRMALTNRVLQAVNML